MNAIEQIRSATLKLRTESGCDEWATRVKAGKIQLVRCSPLDSGKFRTWPISDYLPLSAMAEFINRIPR